MDPSSIAKLVAILVLVVFSAYFSATETAFTSLNRIRLKSRAEAGDRRAASTLALADDYDRLLSTILIGNNVVNNASTSLATLLFISCLLYTSPPIPSGRPTFWISASCSTRSTAAATTPPLPPAWSLRLAPIPTRCV